MPIDLVTTSASGLDPDISIRAARYQIPRVAKIRNVEDIVIYNIVESIKKTPWLNVFGVERVNVLELNLALDRLQQEKTGG